MQKDSKSLVADPVAGLAKLDLSAQPSPDGHDFTLQDDVPDNNLHPLVLTDKFKENLKHSKQTQNPANFQPKKSFCSWKHLRKLQILVAIFSALIVGANNLVQLWQNLDMSNRPDLFFNNLDGEQVKPESGKEN
ncbi:MAG: hypothetical protein RIE73_15815 [Coleofasciculus sp. C1-SOL-03]|jgi:hypothetical protein|uniref:hypothetical protein n=1 Tax=Coleofasciculus sp. C1-SOL-03 TaxID=3069522 RepID=UPI0032F291C8